MTLIDKEAVMSTLRQVRLDCGDTISATDAIGNALSRISSLEPPPAQDGDLISRKQTIERLKAMLSVDWLNSDDIRSIEACIDTVTDFKTIPAAPAPDGDLISRKAAIKAMKEIQNIYQGEHENANALTALAMTHINKLPAALAEQEKPIDWNGPVSEIPCKPIVMDQVVISDMDKRISALEESMRDLVDDSGDDELCRCWSLRELKRIAKGIFYGETK